MKRTHPESASLVSKKQAKQAKQEATSEDLTRQMKLIATLAYVDVAPVITRIIKCSVQQAVPSA